MINQESVVMRNTYIRTALVLSFMQGLAINDWVLQQTKRLFLRCNRDVTNGIGPIHHTHDERLWFNFGQDFCHVFMDTALEQWAYGKLTNYVMKNQSINKYILWFKHLL